MPNVGQDDDCDEIDGEDHKSAHYRAREATERMTIGCERRKQRIWRPACKIMPATILFRERAE